MTIILNKLLDFKQTVFRNIRGVNFDEFDDLSPDPKARAYAHMLSGTKESRTAINDIQYHAIDYIFLQKSWIPSRFSNGEFPVWYGAVNLETGFHETIYHWQRTFLEAPHDFTELNEAPIVTYRTVFEVDCHAALIDLRNKAAENKELIDPDPMHYPEVQKVGQRISQEGYPGVISQSARIVGGEIVAVFKKEILKKPVHYQDYYYEFDLQNQKRRVKQSDSHREVLVL